MSVKRSGQVFDDFELDYSDDDDDIIDFTTEQLAALDDELDLNDDEDANEVDLLKAAACEVEDAKFGQNNAHESHETVECSERSEEKKTEVEVKRKRARIVISPFKAEEEPVSKPNEQKKDPEPCAKDTQEVKKVRKRITMSPPRNEQQVFKKKVFENKFPRAQNSRPFRPFVANRVPFNQVRMPQFRPMMAPRRPRSIYINPNYRGVAKEDPSLVVSVVQRVNLASNRSVAPLLQPNICATPNPTPMQQNPVVSRMQMNVSRQNLVPQNMQPIGMQQNVVRQVERGKFYGLGGTSFTQPFAPMSSPSNMQPNMQIPFQQQQQPQRQQFFNQRFTGFTENRPILMRINSRGAPNVPQLHATNFSNDQRMFNHKMC